MYMMGGGAVAGLVASSRALVAIANREGKLLELKDFDWSSVDLSTYPQEEFKRLQDLVGEYLLTKTKEKLFREALKESILLAPIVTIGDVVHSPQLSARDWFIEMFHPELENTITYPGAPLKLSDSPWQIRQRAPLIGEHNSNIYGEELGLSREELENLKYHGVI